LKAKFQVGSSNRSFARAETIGALKTRFDTDNLHRPTSPESIGAVNTGFDAVNLHRPPSAETIGAFNRGFDTVTLHGPTFKNCLEPAIIMWEPPPPAPQWCTIACRAALCPVFCLAIYCDAMAAGQGPVVYGYRVRFVQI
jgi:hypothetical protein